MEQRKYPAPDKKIKYFWDLYVDDVTSRDNFKEGHLEQLRILCDLHTKYVKLSEDIDENGYTYESDGRYGFKELERVEVKIWKNVLAEIRQYSRVLGLILVKDNKLRNEDEGDSWI